jgi:hypothetical protein
MADKAGSGVVSRSLSISLEVIRFAPPPR